MRIAVDAMGGDFAPSEIVKGAVEAGLNLPDVSGILLVGNEDAVRAELRKAPGAPPNIEVLHASEVVAMNEAPAAAIRRKKDSSISRGMDAIKQGSADAFVSAGNTGAVVVAATLKLRTLPGVDRPAIALVLPSPARPFILIDAGANTDCNASLLAQFAVMGSVYSRLIMGQANPVVGLMSVGGEEGKGNEVTKEAFGILQDSRLNFRGNMEGNDLFKGETDVVVCDGFVGNVVLKTSESVAHAIGAWLKQEFAKSPIRILGATLLRGAFKAMKRKTDPAMYGGALLLGIDGVCIIAHGASRSRAIFHAIRVACQSVHHGLNETIAREIAGLRTEK